MPKDEDILQLVSPALLFEVEDPWGLGARVQPFSLGLLPVLAPLGGRKESGGGSTNPALLHQRCQAHPWAGAGCCFIQDSSVLGEREAPALAGRIPARVSRRRVAQRALPDWHVLFLSALMRHLFSAPHPCLAQSECVSRSCVHTHTAFPTALHCHVLMFTQHTSHHSAYKQNIPDTQPPNITLQHPFIWLTVHCST